MHNELIISEKKSYFDQIQPIKLAQNGFWNFWIFALFMSSVKLVFGLEFPAKFGLEMELGCVLDICEGSQRS